MPVLKRWNGSTWEQVGATPSGTPIIKRRVRAGLGNIATMSTSWTPIDATNLAYLTFTLAVGDMVRLTLACSASNDTTSWATGFDFEVDRPISANINVADGCEYGVVSYISKTGSYWEPVAATAVFIATEAGVHGFRPVWKVEGQTGTVSNAASGARDTLITFLAEHWPAVLVG